MRGLFPKLLSTDIGKGYVKGEIGLKSDLMNPTGILHGGVMVTLADTVAIFGCGYLYEVVTIATLDLTVSFLKPVKTGKVTACGKVLSRGRSLSLWQVDEFDESGNLIAVVNVTFSIN